MGNMTIAVIFVIFLNVMLFLGQTSITLINPDGLSCDATAGTIIQTKMLSNSTNINNSIMEDLPGAATGSSGFIIDLFTNIGSWFKKTGEFLVTIISGPYNILKCSGLPSFFVNAVGTLWYLITLFVVVSYFWWRD